MSVALEPFWLRLPALSALAHGAFVFAGLLTYVLATRIGRQRRHPAAAVGWVLLIALLPYAGVPLFLTFGSRKFARPGRDAQAGELVEVAPAEPRWALELAAAMNLPKASYAPRVEFHEHGHAAQAAQLRSIARARHSIDLCTYVLAPDEIGQAMGEALIASAARGVRVRVLLDAVGSLKTTRRQFRMLRDAGIAVRWFMPLLHNPLRGRSNLRNHRKLLLIDGEQMNSGGRNQAAEYFVDRPGAPAWVDLNFTVHGVLARQAQQVFEHDWAIAPGHRARFPFPGVVKAERRAPGARDARNGAAERVRVDPTTKADPTLGNPGTEEIPGRVEPRKGGVSAAPVTSAPQTPRAQLVPSGPDHADDTAYSLLLASAYQSRRRILAATPYFVPDDALLSAWCMACRRGVEITLLLPRRSNHRLADYARERALRTLAQAGASVYLYPTMLHAKAVVVDDDFAMCGSLNLDGRSLFLNYELMTAFYGRVEIDWLEAWFARNIGASRRYHPQAPSWGRDLVEGVVRAIGFQL